MINRLAFLLSRVYQTRLLDGKRAKTHKRRTHFRYAQMQTLRHELINRAWRLVNDAGQAIPEVGVNPALLATFRTYERSVQTRHRIVASRLTDAIGVE